MDAYTGLAALYDIFMDNIPYYEWYDYLKSLLAEYNINKGIVLDLGCGTGNMTELLAADGYDMIGIDNSSEMLNIAMEKAYDKELNILYLLQDMREFELYGTVAAVVSLCDSLNYITEHNELVKVFSLVNNYLDPDGIFIFDMTTSKKYEDIADSVIAENREEGSFIWENTYFEGEKINRYDMTIFERLDNGLYKRHQETHIQRVYTLDEIKSALDLAGLKFEACYKAFTRQKPDNDCERIYVIARESVNHNETKKRR